MSCPDCGSASISYFKYELTCTQCGLVVGGSFIDDTLDGQPFGYANQVEEIKPDLLSKDVESHLTEIRNVLSRYIYEDFSDSFYTRLRELYNISIALKPIKGRNKQLRILGLFVRTQRKLSPHEITLIINTDIKQLGLTEKELLDEANRVWELCHHEEPKMVQFKQVEQDNIQQHLQKLNLNIDQRKDIVRVYDKLKKRLPDKLLIRKDILDWTLVFMAGRFLNMTFQLKEFEKKSDISYTTLLKTEKVLKCHLMASNS